MTKLLAILTLALASSFASAYATEKKEVCIDKIEKGKPVLDKQGKPVQTCRTIVVHKKLEGTKVEDAKKDQPKK